MSASSCTKRARSFRALTSWRSNTSKLISKGTDGGVYFRSIHGLEIVRLGLLCNQGRRGLSAEALIHELPRETVRKGVGATLRPCFCPRRMAKKGFLAPFCPLVGLRF